MFVLLVVWLGHCVEHHLRHLHSPEETPAVEGHRWYPGGIDKRA
jgi:hypothetical protein